MGNLPPRVLTDKEFKGFSNSEMKKAAVNVTDNYKGLEVLLTNPERCLELINKQFSQATMPQEKTILASILCILGDKKRSSHFNRCRPSICRMGRRLALYRHGAIRNVPQQTGRIDHSPGQHKESSALTAILERQSNWNRKTTSPTSVQSPWLQKRQATKKPYLSLHPCCRNRECATILSSRMPKQEVLPFPIRTTPPQGTWL